MDWGTIVRLDAINRSFYDRCAASFDAKRRRPWEGWGRVVDHLSDLERPSILDVGCGNGRFGLYAARRLGRAISYVGVDRSRELLERARLRGRRAWRWVAADLVRDGLPVEATGQGFDLVACFGVMHHLPREAVRRELLIAMSRQVALSGRLAISFWQFGERERFVRRAVEAAEAVGSGDLRPGDLRPGDLEPGDYLLPWGEASGDAGSLRLRYCHHVDGEEAERLLDDVALGRRESFRADGATGDLNLYYLLGRDRSTR